MVLGSNHTLYVGDDGNLDGITLGRLTRFNSETGAFLLIGLICGAACLRLWHLYLPVAEGVG